MDEFIMANDEFVEESYDDSYDDVTLEDVESYLESVKENIINAVDIHDDMIQEGYEYEDMSVEDVEMYIESAINDYNDGVDLYNDRIMESDDNVTDDFEEGWEDSPEYKEVQKMNDLYQQRASRIKHFNDKWAKHEDDYIDNPRAFKNYQRFKKAVTEPTLHKIKWDEDVRGLEDDADKILHKRAVQNVKKRIPKSIDGSIRKKYRLPTSADYDAEWNKNGMSSPKTEYALTDYRDNELDLELEEPLTAYEFFDESYEPDDSPIVPYSAEGVYLEEKQELTEVGAAVIGSAIGAVLGSLIGAGISLIDKLITDKKYGRFPKDMKRLYEIVESADFEASENKRVLRKALKAVEKDIRWMLGGIGSRWKITVNEATELQKFKRHVDDLYTRGWMLTKNKETSNARRVPERIKDMVKQGNKVLEILNKSVYKDKSTDSVVEYMI